MNLFFESAVEKELVIGELRAILGRKDESDEMKEGIKKALLCVQEVRVVSRIDI